MERMKNVFCWRVISVMTTLAFAFAWTKDVEAAGEFTILLQMFLMINHWMFEAYWDMRKSIDEDN